MRFRVLGPVEAWTGDTRIDVRGSKMRTVLAALLLSRGRAVSDARLMTLLWGEDLPSTTQAQIQTYVSRLRGLLGAEVRIERQPPGYRLDVPNGRLHLDLDEFERLSAEGRCAAAAGDTARAGRSFTAALALWKGPALAGVTDQLAEVAQPRLEEARLTALDARIDADLALGVPVMVLTTELTALVAEHPLRERPRMQLMLALHRSGRTADALLAYQDFRRVLADELGLDPSAEFRRVHQAILIGCPAVPVVSGPAVVPTTDGSGPEPGDAAGRAGAEASAVLDRTAATLLDLSPADAQDVLEELIAAHLLRIAPIGADGHRSAELVGGLTAQRTLLSHAV